MMFALIKDSTNNDGESVFWLRLSAINHLEDLVPAQSTLISSVNTAD